MEKILLNGNMCVCGRFIWREEKNKNLRGARVCIALLFLARSGESGQSDRIISFPLAAVSSCCVVFLFFFFLLLLFLNGPNLRERVRQPWPVFLLKPLKRETNTMQQVGGPQQEKRRRRNFNARGNRLGSALGADHPKKRVESLQVGGGPVREEGRG